MNGNAKRTRLDQRRAPIHEALENFRVADGKIVESWGYWPDKEIETKLR